MKIPSSFTVGQQQINVEYSDFGGDIANDGKLGRCNVSKGKILLSLDQSQTSLENTFIHEALHSALDTAGYYDLSSDESFVSTIAAFLLEIINTSKYDE